MYRKQLSKEQAIQKLRHYCAYQERCHSEVKNKLFELGVRKADHDEIISGLIEDNYLNEERFAMAFARGKWRMKQWGRTRIRYELKQRQVSDYCINKALKQILDEEYEGVLAQLTRARYDSLKSEQYLVRKKKTIDFLVQKGYEPDLVNMAVSQLGKAGHP